jgi:hypothetical protein
MINYSYLLKKSRPFYYLNFLQTLIFFNKNKKKILFHGCYNGLVVLTKIARFAFRFPSMGLLCCFCPPDETGILSSSCRTEFGKSQWKMQKDNNVGLSLPNELNRCRKCLNIPFGISLKIIVIPKFILD